MPLLAAIATALLALTGAPLTAPAASEDGLEKRHEEFLEIAAPLLDRKARRTFLGLEQEYQRDEFIRAFWKALDPTPDTERNEFRADWMARAEQARLEFGGLDDERAKIFLVQGPPQTVVEDPCDETLYRLDIWVYQRSRQGRVVAVFVDTGNSDNYRPWVVTDGPQRLTPRFLSSMAPPEPTELEGMYRWIQGAQNSGNARPQLPLSLESINGVRSQDGDWLKFLFLLYQDCFGELEAVVLLLEAIAMEKFTPDAAGQLRAPDPGIFGEETEWLTDLGEGSTDVPKTSNGLLPAEVEVAFTGRKETRTVVDVAIVVEPAEAALAEGPEPYSSFQINGEILRGEELFENFRYRYEVPRDSDDPTVGDDLRLSFERLLRPGTYTLVLRLEDLESGRFFRYREPLDVPRVEATPERDAEVTETLGAVRDQLVTEQATLRLEVPERPFQSGYTRVLATAEGPVERVTFRLDGADVLTRNRPPFTVDLDLGDIPRPRTLVAIGFDADGTEVIRDAVEINGGRYRFAVRLEQPRAGSTYQGSVPLEADVSVPSDQELDRLELFADDRLLATLFQAPFRRELPLTTDQPTLIRAVATLANGSSTEDVVLINVPGESERIRVRMVELYVSARRDGRPATDLEEGDFQVVDQGTPQTLSRFEQVEDLPLHLMVLIDTSGSMENRLEDARTAAHTFFSDSVRPDDRVAVTSFHEQPQLRVDFTGDVEALQTGLRGLVAGRGTALYDSLVFSLYQFQGMKGQRALLLLTDGKDQGSSFEFEEALEYARRSGVTIYAIGLEKLARSPLAKGKLDKLTEITGGRSYFLDSIAELPEVYKAIEQELRSRYLLVYQTSVGDDDREFREVQVQVTEAGVEVKAPTGYYP